MSFYFAQEAAEVVRVLEGYGFEAYYVGGCVRDNLLGVVPKDFDVTTNAMPEQVIECFSSYQVIPTGLRHGTVTVIINHVPVEVTTYRIDGSYTDNRHPEQVAFTASLREDLKRRDFTVNALAYNKKTGLIDYFGGLADLKAKRIRCVGEPCQRFHEDALRILRALRFSSVLSFSVESKTSRAVHEWKGLLENIAKERIAAEFGKMLCGFGIEHVMLEYPDVLEMFIPEYLPAVGFQQNNAHHIYDVYTHICKTVAHAPPVLTTRLTMAFHDIGKPNTFTRGSDGVGHFYGHHKEGARMAREILTRLRYDNTTIDRVETLILYHDVSMPGDKKTVKRWMNRLTVPVLQELMQVKKADTLGKNPKYFYKIPLIYAFERQMEQILQSGECYNLKGLAVNGSDLIAEGLPRGKGIGFILDGLLEAVIDETVPNEKQPLLQYAEQLYQKFSVRSHDSF